jgi:hypothetical protein
MLTNVIDGGVQMDMLLNGKALCTSEAIYGDNNESAEMGGHSHGAGMGEPKAEAAPKAAAEPKSSTAIKTITGMTTCSGPFPVKKGDTLSMAAIYDLKKHPLRVSLSGSKAADVMGMWGISFSADPVQKS